MSGSTLWRMDWSLVPGAMAREAAVRFLLLSILCMYFAALLLSGGMNRYLSDSWAVTAVLRSSVTDEEGEGIAKKSAGLPGVGSAVYRNPEESWKEFLAAYPGLEGLRASGGRPLPGYVEIRMRPDGFTGSRIRSIESFLAPLPEVERVLSGGETLPRILRVAAWTKAALWAAFGLLASSFFAIFRLQEKARAAQLSADFDFLAERGIPARRIALSRAAGSAAVGLALSLASAAASVSVLFLLSGRIQVIHRVVGPPGEIFALSFLLPWTLFISAAAVLSGGASLLGWRAALPRRG